MWGADADFESLVHQDGEASKGRTALGPRTCGSKSWVHCTRGMETVSVGCSCVLGPSMVPTSITCPVL